MAKSVFTVMPATEFRVSERQSPIMDWVLRFSQVSVSGKTSVQPVEMVSLTEQHGIRLKVLPDIRCRFADMNMEMSLPIQNLPKKTATAKAFPVTTNWNENKSLQNRRWKERIWSIQQMVLQ